VLDWAFGPKPTHVSTPSKPNFNLSLGWSLIKAVALTTLAKVVWTNGASITITLFIYQYFLH